MKRNSFYILTGLILLIEIVLFWWSIEIVNPLPIQAGIVTGIVAIFLGRRYVDEVIEDERTNLITQKAAVSTLLIFWVILFVYSIGGAVLGLGAPGIPLPKGWRPGDRPMMNENHLGIFAFAQIVLLSLMIFLYVAFRMYYSHKYGEWDDDEE